MRSNAPLDDAFYKNLMEDQLWGMIRRTAKNDPILQDMLNEVIVFWKLKYERNYSNKKETN